MKNCIITAFLVVFGMGILNVYAQTPNQVIEQRVELSEQYSKLISRKITLRSVHNSKLNSLKNQQSAYLRNFPNDLVIRWHRAEVFLILGKADSAVHDFVAVVEYAEETEKGWYANNFSVILAELVSSGRKEFEEDCCKLEQIRKSAGIWRQECMPDSSVEVICGCID